MQAGKFRENSMGASCHVISNGISRVRGRMYGLGKKRQDRLRARSLSTDGQGMDGCRAYRERRFIPASAAEQRRRQRDRAGRLIVARLKYDGSIRATRFARSSGRLVAISRRTNRPPCHWERNTAVFSTPQYSLTFDVSGYNLSAMSDYRKGSRQICLKMAASVGALFHFNLCVIMLAELSSPNLGISLSLA